MPTGRSSPARIEKRLAAKARARASKAKEELDITVSLLDGEPTTMKLLAGDKVGAVVGTAEGAKLGEIDGESEGL